MLVYSAKTAKSYPYIPTKVMTSSQRDQFYRAFKKYAINQFKRSVSILGAGKFDGTQRVFSRNVFSISLFDFYNSKDCSALSMSKDFPHWLYFNTGKDNEMICRKTIPLIKAAGYKAEYENNRIIMWKPLKR